MLRWTCHCCHQAGRPGRTTLMVVPRLSVDTWLASVKGRDTEEWVGETIFDIEGCARVPAQSMYVQGSSCKYSGDLDPMRVSPAFQAEENVVCNFNCRTAQLVHSRHSVSRRAVPDAGVYLQGLSSHFYLVVNPILVVSEMPGAPTRSTADNTTAARQKVGSPRILGANPNSYFLRDIPSVNRMDMFQWLHQPLQQWPVFPPERCGCGFLDRRSNGSY